MPAPMPFAVSSRNSTRHSFDVASTTLNASAPTPINPIQLPANGYLKSLYLEVTGTVTGGTTPAYTADGPFNVFSQIGLRTASGYDILTNMTGYQAFLVNKYGGYKVNGDPRNPVSYSATTSGFHFFIKVPFEIDPVTGLGAVPNLASNRSYQLNMTLAATGTVMSGAPTVAVQVSAYAEYWLEPAANAKNGQAQATQPQGTGTISRWLIENPSLTPGDKLLKFNNVAGVIRNHILVIRNASSARITDGNGWPTNTETQLILDNETNLALTNGLWKQKMAEWFDLNSASYDVFGGLDTGVFVLPYHAFNGAVAGDPNNTRTQLLPAMDASQIELRTTYGSSVATLEILTNLVAPAQNTGLPAIFSK